METDASAVRGYAELTASKQLKNAQQKQTAQGDRHRVPADIMPNDLPRTSCCRDQVALGGLLAHC